jgi:hypothetical protein
MNELEADETRILEQARRGLSPTLADRERIKQGIVSQLGVAGASGALPKRLDAGALRAARWVAVAGFFALGGALGYWQGYRAGAKGGELISVVRSVPVAPLARPSPLATEQSSLPAPSAGNAALAIAKSARIVTLNPSARAPSEAARPAEALGLDEEVRQLRRVEKAIRDNNPRFALVLLDELDTDIPAGQLLEERKAASLMANCQLDAPTASDDARAFATRYAHSAYVARLFEICRLPANVGERISPAPGTSVPR